MNQQSESQRKGLIQTGLAVANKYFGVTLFETQALILGAILEPTIKEVAIITPTRYGKTFVIGMGALISASLLDYEVQIGGGDKEKAGIAMNKIVKFLPSVDMCITQDLIGGDTLSKVSQSLSKSKLGWSSGGSIDIFSVSERLKSSSTKGEGAIGLGGDLIILDESALISDDNYSTVRRMLAENTHTKLVEISNPHRENHFKKSMHDPEVFTIWIDEQVALNEGRFDPQSLARAKKDMTPRAIDIFFRCQFVSEVENAFFDTECLNRALEATILTGGTRVMGIDVARSGGDRVVYSIGRRKGNRFVLEEVIIEKTNVVKMPVTHVAGKAMQLANEFDVVYIGVDVLGLGAGVFDILFEQWDGEVVEFIASQSAENKETYANRKAEVADLMRIGMRDGYVALPDHAQLREDLNTYEEAFDSKGRIRIKDPEKSPDVGDATLIAYSLSMERRDADLSFL